MREELIEQIILDVCIHENVSDGIIDFSIQEHIDALIEVLKRKSFPVESIKEIVNKLNEGKYPERQAYNREGFLVTFPNPDYKKKALTTGEYSNQDPTKGKGGMHLIKKVEPVSTSTPSAGQSSAPAEQKPVSPSPTAPTPPEKQVSTGTETDSTKKVNPSGATQYTTGVPVHTGTDLKLDKITDYRDPSFEWVHNRKWQKRENNNYYDAAGNLKAITGLDGTVVPVSEEERVDLKKFIEDKKKEKLGIEPTNTEEK